LGFTHISLKGTIPKVSKPEIDALLVGSVTAAELGLPVEVGVFIDWLIRKLGPIALGVLLATIIAYLIDLVQSMQRVESKAVSDVLKGFNSCKCKSNTTGYT
jgi:hypothetical protein